MIDHTGPSGYTTVRPLWRQPQTTRALCNKQAGKGKWVGTPPPSHDTTEFMFLATYHSKKNKGKINLCSTFFEVVFILFLSVCTHIDKKLI